MTETMAISTYLSQENILSSIRTAVGDRTQQFTTSMISVTNSNPLLQQADRKSILMACLTAASLDLPINQNLGFAYILPYKDSDGNYVAQFQVGYKGYIQLSQRSGLIKTINVSDVKEGEVTKIDRLTGQYEFNWIEEGRESLPVIGYVAYIELLNGFNKSIYITKLEAEKHGKKYSQTYKSTKEWIRNKSKWTTDFDAMAKKTVLKLLLSKYAPLSTQMAKAIEADQAVIKEDGVYEYPDNQKDLIDPKKIASDKEKLRIIKFINEAESLEQLEQCEPSLDEYDLRKEYRVKKQALLLTNSTMK